MDAQTQQQILNEASAFGGRFAKAIMEDGQESPLYCYPSRERGPRYRRVERDETAWLAKLIAKHGEASVKQLLEADNE
jgi:hypothetical protein